MKAYYASRTPHHNYLSQATAFLQKQINPVIITHQITITQKYIYQIVFTKTQRIIVWKVQIGSSQGQEYHLLVEWKGIVNAFLVENVVIIQSDDGYVGRIVFEQLKSISKFGKVSIFRNNLQQWILQQNQGYAQNIRSLRSFRLNAQQFAIYHIQNALRVHLMPLNYLQAVDFTISVKMMGYDSNHKIIAFAFDEKVSYGPQKDTTVISLVVLLQFRKECISKQIFLLISIRYTTYKKFQIQYYEIYERATKQNIAYCNLKLCFLDNQILTVSCQQQMIVFKNQQDIWTMAGSICVQHQIQKLIGYKYSEDGANYIITVQQYEGCLYVKTYNINQILSLQHEGPKIIHYEKILCQKTGYLVQLRTVNHTVILFQSVSTSFVIYSPIFGITSILMNQFNVQNYTNQVSWQQQDSLLQLFEDQNINYPTLSMKSFRQLKILISKNVKLFQKHFKQLWHVDEITKTFQIISKIFNNKLIFQFGNQPALINQLHRQILILFHYFIKFIHFLRNNKQPTAVIIPFNINDLMPYIQTYQVYDILNGAMLAQELQLDHMITSKLKTIHQHLIVIDILFSSHRHKHSKFRFEAESQILQYQSIIEDIEFQQIIQYMLSPKLLIQYLISAIYVNYKSRNLQKARLIQRLLSQIVKKLKDFPSLIYLMAGQFESFAINKRHLLRCHQQIQKQKQQNQQDFNNLILVQVVETRMEQYIKRHQLKRLTVYSSHLTDKFQTNQISVKLQTDFAHQLQQCVQQYALKQRLLVNNNQTLLILNQQRIIQILFWMNQKISSVNFVASISDPLANFNQKIRLQNQKLIKMLRICDKLQQKRRIYNLSIQYDLQPIPNQIYKPISFTGYYERISMFTFDKDYTLKLLFQNYFKQLLKVCSQYQVITPLQVINKIIEKYSKTIPFQNYLKDQDMHNMSIIDNKQTVQMECPYFQLVKQEIKYIQQFSQRLNQLYFQLVKLSQSFTQIDQLVHSSYFIQPYLEIQKQITQILGQKDNPQLKHFKGIQKQRLPSYSTFPTFCSYSQIPFDKSLKAGKTMKMSQRQLGFLQQVANKRKHYIISLKDMYISTHTNLKYINFIQVCLKYGCSVFNSPLDILEEFLSTLYRIRQSQKFTYIQQQGIQSIFHLFDFIDI